MWQKKFSSSTLPLKQDAMNTGGGQRRIADFDPLRVAKDTTLLASLLPALHVETRQLIQAGRPLHPASAPHRIAAPFFDFNLPAERMWYFFEVGIAAPPQVRYHPAAKRTSYFPECFSRFNYMRPGREPPSTNDTASTLPCKQTGLLRCPALALLSVASR